MAEEKTNLVFHYFGVKARGLAALVGSAYWGKDLHWEKYSFDDWKNNKNNIKDQAPFGQLPVLADGDFIIGQSNAIVRYLGKKWDKVPADVSEYALYECLIEEAGDLFSLIYSSKQGNNWKDLREKAPKHLTAIEKLMTGNQFFSEMTMSDMVLFSSINIMIDCWPNALAKYNKLRVWYHKINSNSAVKALLDSSRKYIVNPNNLKPMPNPTWQQTMIRVKDPEKSLAFYVDIMGMTLIDVLDFPSQKFKLYFLTTLPTEEKYPHTPGTPEAQAYLWNMKDVALELTYNYGSENRDDIKYHPGNGRTEELRDGFGHLAFACEDVRKSCKMLEEKNVKFQKKPDEGRMKGLAFALDPDGYWIEIITRVKKDCAHLPEFTLAQTMLRVKDPEKSLAFYTQVCGMTVYRSLIFKSFSLYFLGTVVDGDAPDMSDTRNFYNKGPVLELTHNHGTETKEGPVHFNGNEENRKGFGHIGFLVDDVDEACAALEANGMEITKKPGSGNMTGFAFASDPDGYKIEIIPRGGMLTKNKDGKFGFIKSNTTTTTTTTTTA